MQQQLFESVDIYQLQQGQLSYIPQFLSLQQASHFYAELTTSLQWKQEQIKMFGRLVTIPRLQAWYGDSNASYRYSGLAMQPLPWTDELRQLKQLVSQHCQLEFNSVLVNWYRDGADKMGYHSDDEKELGTRPVIASLSLGACRRLA